MSTESTPNTTIRLPRKLKATRALLDIKDENYGIIVTDEDLSGGGDDVTMTVSDSDDALHDWPPLTVWLTGLILGE